MPSPARAGSGFNVADLDLALTLLIVGKHAGNIRRLVAGTESKLGARG